MHCLQSVAYLFLLFFVNRSLVDIHCYPLFQVYNIVIQHLFILLVFGADEKFLISNEGRLSTFFSLKNRT